MRIRIESALKKLKWESTWLHGKMSVRQRDSSLKHFWSSATCNVLLASIGAAGVEIDLRCAENVYNMVSLPFFSFFYNHEIRKLTRVGL